MSVPMKTKLRRFVARLQTSYHKNPSVFLLRTAVLVGVVVWLFAKRSFLTPDTLFVILLAVFSVFGQARPFLTRFLPFLALLLVYDSFRGVADDLNKNVHFWEMIYFDTAVFGGQLPTVTLQQWWWHGTVQWYDFYFYFLYIMHFVAPVLLGVLIWKKRDSLYWPYVWSLVGLSFAAFVTYVIFPAAPPWMASELNMIPQIQRISSDIWWAMGITNFSEVYSKLSPNAVAAIPSLHSAYPMLFVLFLTKLYGWKNMGWTMFYPISIWVGVVYLGEHYVIDAILGALYAIGAYFAIMQLFAWQKRHDWPVQRWASATFASIKLQVVRLTIGE